MSEIHGAVALVTGANRGLGRHFADQLLERGRPRSTRRPRPATVDLPGVVPVQLDITDPASVARAAEAAPDVTLLINNAGIAHGQRLHRRRPRPDPAGDGDALLRHAGGDPRVRAGPRRERRRRHPQRAVGALLAAHPGEGAYSVAKAAAWAQTNVVRQELAPLGIQVAALHVGYMDTRMSDDIDPSMKSAPAVIAALALDGVAAGDTEILGDEITRSVKQQLSAAPVAA